MMEKYKTVFWLAVFSIGAISLHGQTERLDLSEYDSDSIQIHWYPNPVTVGQKITVELKLEIESEAKIEVISAMGKVVFEVTGIYPKGKSVFEVFTIDYQPGLYIVRISTDYGQKSEFIVVEN